MWLLLCHPHDASALWAARRLRARGIDPLIVLSPETLQHSFGWRHHLRTDGPLTISFTLASGRTIHGHDIRGVLNRIQMLPPAVVAHLPEADRGYALQEWFALHMSWLAALPAPVFNPPVMQGFCGAFRHPTEWSALAARAGLVTRPFQQSAPIAGTDTLDAPALFPPCRTILVINGTVIGAGDDGALAGGCQRLGAIARTPLLGIDVDPSGGFVNATPLPDLRTGGEPCIDALHAELVGDA